MAQIASFVLDEAFGPNSPISDELTIAGIVTRGSVIENYQEGANGVSDVSLMATIKGGGDVSHIVSHAAVRYNNKNYEIGSVRHQPSEGTILLILHQAA